ncbi:oxidoreductase-like domain-containing protein [Lachnospiraceae bacterium EP-SM-12S-S03]|nr:oxidoreductase-like domain-containing protein [Lachnospiraceae bacterium EP-SM-12S-S03]
MIRNQTKSCCSPCNQSCRKYKCCNSGCIHCVSEQYEKYLLQVKDIFQFFFRFCLHSILLLSLYFNKFPSKRKKNRLLNLLFPFHLIYYIILSKKVQAFPHHLPGAYMLHPGKENKVHYSFQTDTPL